MAKKQEECSELALEITQIAMNIGSRDDVRGLDDVVARMQAIPELAPLNLDEKMVSTAINEATTGRQQTKDETAKKLNAIKREARKKSKLYEAADSLQKALEGADHQRPAAEPAGPAPTLELQAQKARLQQEVNQQEVPPDLSRLAQDLAKFYVGEGVLDRNELVDRVHADLVEVLPDITRRQSSDLISGYGQYRQLSKDDIDVKLRDFKGQLQQVSKLEDMAAGQAPARTGVERRSPSDTERGLIKQVEEEKKKGGFQVTDPERQLKTALDAIKTRLRHQIADLEQQIKTRQKIVKTQTAVTRDNEAKELTRQRDELQEQFDAVFGPRQLTDQQRIEIASRSIQKSIDEYERRLRDGDFSPRSKPSKTPDTPELQALRDRRDKLRARYEVANPNPPAVRRALERIEELERHLNEGTLPPVQARKAPGSPVVADLQSKTAALRKALNRSEPAIRKRYQKSIDELTRKLEQEDFAPRIPKQRIPQSAQLERMEFERDRLRREVNQRIRELAPKEIFDYVTIPFQAGRSLMTAFDVSAVGRQGLIIGAGNPARAAKNIGPMLKALGSEQFAQKAMDEIQNRPNAHLYARAKLSLSDLDGPLLAREEAFRSDLAERIPLFIGRGVKASSRAYVSYLNLLRADSFDAMVGGLSRNGEPTQKEMEAIANYINVATGRGPLGKFEKAAEGLSTVFFAPRLLASRFQYLMLQPLWSKGGGSARVRAMIAKEYAKFFVGLSPVIALGLLAGADFELDPRSTDFGKLRFGDTRVDILGGLAQVTTVLARVATGTKKTGSGEVRAIREGLRLPAQERRFADDNVVDVLNRFGRTKFSPLTSTAIDMLAGETVVGENTDFTTKEGATRLGTRLITPLSARDIYEAIQAEGVSTGVALGLVSLFGFGLTTYEQRSAGRKKRKPRSGFKK
jgi:hypothetical protein